MSLMPGTYGTEQLADRLAGGETHPSKRSDGRPVHNGRLLRLIERRPGVAYRPYRPYRPYRLYPDRTALCAAGRCLRTH
ncbi:MAG: hypothetical protein QOC89_4553 [Paraburkholderia sp.]|nr:hypothetical protein [Paraburkholderia sp.]